MRALLAPGGLPGASAADVARGLAAGWPGADVLPLSDGGPGFLAALGLLLPDASRDGPLLLDGTTAYAEAGDLDGLAVPAGTTRLVVGAGPAAPPVPLPRPAVDGVELVLATDEQAALTGLSGLAAALGLDRAELLRLDAELERRADGAGLPAAVRARPGAGAGGGAGAVLLHLGATTTSATSLLADLGRLDDRTAQAGLVVTAVPVLDAAALSAGVVPRVVAAATEHAVPCVVVTGRAVAGRRELGAAGLEEAVLLEGPATDEALRAVAERLSRTWSR